MGLFVLLITRLKRLDILTFRRPDYEFRRKHQRRKQPDGGIYPASNSLTELPHVLCLKRPRKDDFVQMSQLFIIM